MGAGPNCLVKLGRANPIYPVRSWSKKLMSWKRLRWHHNARNWQLAVANRRGESLRFAQKVTAGALERLGVGVPCFPIFFFYAGATRGRGTEKVASYVFVVGAALAAGVCLASA